MPLSLFHPVIRSWFSSKFQSPTEAQAQGWAAIAQGLHTLIAAPTGSGKTLAAFLTCIDRLVRMGMEGDLPDTTQVVYVSPLKALSNDIQRNLSDPLGEIAALAEERGTPIPQIRTAVRTGDTKASERQRMAKVPPHILITTPESLYILLTSKSGRQGLRGVNTLILDEIHAVADDKRGSHLSLSVERLCALAEGPVTRIGLSATQRPIEEMARFLVGTANIQGDGTPKCTIVDAGHSRTLDLDILLPGQRELGPIATHEMWDETLDAIAGLAQAHGTTLLFVNTRRLVERVAHQLSKRMGEDAVVAHHGSLSRATRLAAEEKLKRGEVKVCVATASLELGIDIGLVDLVCQVGSPRSIGVLLQRIGRSGHSLGATPKGRLFPLTRDELAECAALAMAIREGNLDTLTVPPWPVDVLAQQVVAACAGEEWDEEELYHLCKKAYPYRDLPREKYDQVLEGLSQGFAQRQGRGGARLHRDKVNGRIKGRRGAGIAALTSGGAIPDTADYDVIADPEGVFVGTVNEDFAIESMGGDVFLLGNTPWKIRRVEQGRVRVEDAHGQTPGVPFWLGEAPGRTRELSQEITRLRGDLEQRLEHPEEAEDWVVSRSGVSREVARQLVAYLAEGKRVLGMVPTGGRIIAERFFDESGGMQLVIHAPLGSRINRAWGMALRKRICTRFDFELQASANDDGLNFSLGPQLSFPLDEVFTYLKPQTVEGVLVQAVLQSPLFGTRWRWAATRALAILRHTGGRKVPAPLLRMRSDDLLAAVFPAQVQCQDNAPAGGVELPDHPLVFEAMRDCLTEAMDLEGLKEVLAGIDRGDIEVYARDTVQPSVFAHQILNAMPYAFLDDAPLEERRARAVSLRRALPEDPQDLGALDPAAIAQESANAWPPIRDADELHDALLTLGVLPKACPFPGEGAPAGEDLGRWLEELAGSGRAYRLALGNGQKNGRSVWSAAECLHQALAAYPGADTAPHGPRDDFQAQAHVTQDEAVLALVRGWAECLGPFTAGEMASTLGFHKSDVEVAIARLEGEGLVLRGRFRPEAEEPEVCDRRILARIHRSTIGRLRRDVQPVSQSTFMRFLFRWQRADQGPQVQGEGGLLDVVELLQGFEAPAASWEPGLLATRVSGYSPSALDQLCIGGEVVWGRPARTPASGASAGRRSALTRTTPITLCLREALDWLLEPSVNDSSAERAGAPAGAPEEVLAALERRGASFLPDIAARTGRLASDVEEALWVLVAAGLATSDGMEALRRRISASVPRGRRPSPSRRTRRNPRAGYSRWSLLEAVAPVEDQVEPRARQLLRRYGILFPELLAREAMAPRWRDMVRVLRRLEARGEIRGGRFVAGLVGEQFALPEAIELLREVKRDEGNGRLVAVSACDPLNLVGVVTPGERVPASIANVAVYLDGTPICSLEAGRLVQRSAIDGETEGRVRSLLGLASEGSATPPVARAGSTR